MIVRSEDAKWIKNIGVYFAILKEINEDLLKLIKYDSNYNEKIELLFFEIAVNLNRIFPLKSKKISDDDGILKLKKYIDFLKTDYNLTAVKIIPYTFAQMFDDISVTALSNDDGFFGSYVLLFDDGQQKIGYAPRFITQGWHKKRLKKWKKAFKDAQLTQLILSSKITQPASQALPDLSHYQQVLMADKPQDLLIKGNPFSLDTLFMMDDICQKLAIKA